MSSRKIKFGDKEVDKKIYLSKQAISLDSVFQTNGRLMIQHINICLGI